MTLKFVPLPEVNGIFEWGTGSVVRVFPFFGTSRRFLGPGGWFVRLF